MKHLVVQGSLDPPVYWGLGCANRRSIGSIATQRREVFGYAGVDWGTKEAVGDGCGMRERGVANINWEEVS